MSVALRKLTSADLEAAWAWASDPEFTRHLTWSTYTSRDALAGYLRAAEAKAGYPDQVFAILLEGDVVGSIHCVERGEGCVQFGYGVIRPRWGEGIGRRAALLALREVAATWPCEVFWADVHRENTRGRRLAEAVGFRLHRAGVEADRDRYALRFDAVRRGAG